MTSVYYDSEELARAAADLFVSLAQEAISARGEFRVALSGGSTPKILHAFLTTGPRREAVDWKHVFIFWGDERYVLPSDEQSNEKMARETLLNLVPIPENQIFPMYAQGGPEHAADLYSSTLSRLKQPPLFDLVLLGLGADGHTASLFPDEPGVFESERLVIAAKAPVNAPDRLTLTPPALLSARHVVFLVSGADKAEALFSMLEGDEDFNFTPAQAIARKANKILVLADTPAASLLS